MVDDGLGGKRTYRGAKTIGHQHEQSLCAGAYILAGGLIDEEGARDVEEVEGHAIDDHRDNKHPYAAARITRADESEAEHPCEHGDEHHVLDTEFLHEERDEQDTAGLTDL